jgi:hypothetical protein
VLKFGSLIKEALKPPMVKTIHPSAMPEIPIYVQPRRELYLDTDAMKAIMMPLVGVEMAAAGKRMSSPREQVVDACVLPKESQPALNIGLECSNDCLESFIHG